MIKTSHKNLKPIFYFGLFDDDFTFNSYIYKYYI